MFAYNEGFFQKKLVDKAKADPKTIVLPESSDVRVLQAAEYVSVNNIARIVLLGDEGEIRKIASDNNIRLDRVSIVGLDDQALLDRYVDRFVCLRSHKGVGREQALEKLGRAR